MEVSQPFVLPGTSEGSICSVAIGVKTGRAQHRKPEVLSMECATVVGALSAFAGLSISSYKNLALAMPYCGIGESPGLTVRNCFGACESKRYMVTIEIRQMLRPNLTTSVLENSPTAYRKLHELLV